MIIFIAKLYNQKLQKTMTSIKFAEYLWVDGTDPVPLIRSKTRTFQYNGASKTTLKDFVDWTFDGSSTNQAVGKDSDCILKPVNFVKDPIRGEGNYIVICEVFNPDETVHTTNSRAILRESLNKTEKGMEPWIGYEQEYTLYQNGKPLGWPDRGYPAPQGPYYCGVGSEQIAGRELVEDHAQACLDAELMFFGLNAEVMLGQWEFQIGYRGIEGDDNSLLNSADHLLVARWLLYRIAELYDIEIKLDNKPVKGDWNGAGMHTNFSTKHTRDKKNGKKAILVAMKKLEKTHQEHIASYGHNLSERLTGEYETSDMSTFSVGSADRGCSIRIPRLVELKGYGYFEDRRPGANSDPYIVANMLVKSVCL